MLEDFFKNKILAFKRNTLLNHKQEYIIMNSCCEPNLLLIFYKFSETQIQFQNQKHIQWFKLAKL